MKRDPEKEQGQGQGQGSALGAVGCSDRLRIPVRVRVWIRDRVTRSLRDRVMVRV